MFSSEKKAFAASRARLVHGREASLLRVEGVRLCGAEGDEFERIGQLRSAGGGEPAARGQDGRLVKHLAQASGPVV